MWYGIDWNGPVSSADEADTVSILRVEKPLPSHLNDVLHQEIHPLNGDPDQSYIAIRLFVHTQAH